MELFFLLIMLSKHNLVELIFCYEKEEGNHTSIQMTRVSKDSAIVPAVQPVFPRKKMIHVSHDTIPPCSFPGILDFLIM